MAKVKKKVLDDEDLLERTRERIDYLCEEYEAIFMAHSGGKDSQSVYNITMDGWERNKEKMDHPFMPIFHDNETPMPETVELFERIAENNRDSVKIWWTLVPYVASLMTHPDEQTWKVPWDERCPEKWVREMPTEIEDDHPNIELMRPDHDYFEDWEIGDRHYDTAYQIIEGYMDEHDLDTDEVVQLVGLRAEESMNRYTTILNLEGFIQRESEPCHVAHPVYDWGTDDLWALHYQQDWDYNRFYDNLHQQGVAPSNARNGPVWGAYPIRAQKAWNTKHWYPEMYERWERRYPGCVLAFEQGYDLFNPGNLKPDEMSWREYTAKILNSFDAGEREGKSEMVQSRLDRHAEHSNQPLQQQTKCPECDLSWEQMATDLLERLRNYYVEVH